LVPDANNVPFLAADKLVEGVGKQIKLENFVPQAIKRNILKRANENTFKTHEAYWELYYYLIKKNIIKSRAGVASLLTFDSVETINNELIKESDIKRLLNKDNRDFPKKLEPYTIDHKELSDLLEHYKYNAINEVDFYTGPFKGSATKQNKKNSRRRRTITRRRKQNSRN
jgi:hypothetical protein